MRSVGDLTIEWVTRENQGMAWLEFSLMLHLDYRVDGTEKQWGLVMHPCIGCFQRWLDGGGCGLMNALTQG